MSKFNLKTPVSSPLYRTGGRPEKVKFPKPIAGVFPDATSPFLKRADPGLIPSVMKNPRKLVMIECPYGTEDPAKRELYERYAKMCLKDSLRRGEAPFAGQMFYAKLLNTHVAPEKDVGLVSHMSWIAVADIVAIYTDLGISPSMQIAINVATIKNRQMRFRSIGNVS